METENILKIGDVVEIHNKEHDLYLGLEQIEVPYFEEKRQVIIDNGLHCDYKHL